LLSSIVPRLVVGGASCLWSRGSCRDMLTIHLYDTYLLSLCIYSELLVLLCTDECEAKAPIEFGGNYFVNEGGCVRGGEGVLLPLRRRWLRQWPQRAALLHHHQQQQSPSRAVAESSPSYSDGVRRCDPIPSPSISSCVTSARTSVVSRPNLSVH
jgi:hypothetical protein